MKSTKQQHRTLHIWRYFLIVVIAIVSFTQLGWMYQDDTVLVPVRVEKGETIWHIAAVAAEDGSDVRGVVQSILTANHLANNDDIYPGQILQVPVIAQRADYVTTTFTGDK
ncbi:MAG: LysM peptidoglycan-binding domain-containing protein [Megasphaera sp.]|jgi:nucleoid-associated protein YgaU|nr:LysM peptidoglycan-binding domain-containing protein [Megasphaera sp.]MCI1248580.1 LysM peptidoglycan-binding domain-containing protein [Megasphaera sp.]